jgi:hypothetical protein
VGKLDNFGRGSTTEGSMGGFSRGWRKKIHSMGGFSRWWWKKIHMPKT